MESLEQKKRRLFGKQFLQKYMNIIQRLTKTEDEIKPLSIVTTDYIIERQSLLKKKNEKRFEFNDKKEFKKYVINNFNYKGVVYLMTSLSKDCGGIELTSINEFNFEFNYNDEPDGIVSIISSDFKEKILLDFYSIKDKTYIEIEYYC